MESVEKKGIIALAKSPNKANSFQVQVEPDSKMHAEPPAHEDSGDILSLDEHRNVLLDCSGKTEQLSEEVLEAIIAGFEFACKAKKSPRRKLCSPSCMPAESSTTPTTKSPVDCTVLAFPA